MYSLGIDIGSVSISFVLIDTNGSISNYGYHFHRGEIISTLRSCLAEIDVKQVSSFGYNQKSSEFLKHGIACNEQIALVEGIKYQQPTTKSLFSIGGETFGLILFDEQGFYQKYISNSSCAAGTGSFLDQQAERLGLKDSAELSRLALLYDDEPPKIATRCAVFAKTDLIHSQQQGYSLNAICAGLCQGLAQNITETLLGGITLNTPIAIAGGLSQNHKVLDYLSEIIGRPVKVTPYALLTVAIGCALSAMQQNITSRLSLQSLDDIFKQKNDHKLFFFEPLKLQHSSFPDFGTHPHFIKDNVEVDLYHSWDKPVSIPVYLGIDIGSTSTKALLMAANKRKDNIICGLYTRTRGQPIRATQSLFRTIEYIREKYNIRFQVRAVGTTGSGRKFIEKVLRADFAIDEITAHARAAFELNPKIDTIIEIGGQDSKFTLMTKGQVTFSVMNYVCAAGTGSFIEEQANRLGVALEKYSGLAMDSPSPLTSDRCTVFMERDLNHFLGQGYAINELLAAILHSVRDNYLAKVARINKIGEVVCFQGATAKNRALVCAFEQKLQKPIFVSKYCHLTGALGVCYLLREQKIKSSRFRGINFYKEEISTEEELCDKCNNHCKLNKISFAGESITWGYLCGRDETNKSGSAIIETGFDFLRSRRKIFMPGKKIIHTYTGITDKEIKPLFGLDIDLSIDKIRENLEINFLNLRHKIFTISYNDNPDKKLKHEIKIGIPDTLYMQDYLPFWHYLFKKMGYSVVRASRKRNFLHEGKNLSTSEFCAPMSAWHGNMAYLSPISDYIFAPEMFEEEEAEKRNYCYYSNYAVSIIKNLSRHKFSKNLITPKIDFSQPHLNNIQQIYDHLPHELKMYQSPAEIQEIYNEAWQWFTHQKQQLIEIFGEIYQNNDDISVVLLGRPYIILDEELNKNIHKKLSDLGVISAYQDMLPFEQVENHQIANDFIRWNHWKYGEDILKTADYICQHKGLYPVYVTAFKCSPDAFLLSYFREIMNRYDQPYLILQIDEHGSAIGYETRIEAAIRTFRSHFRRNSSVLKKQKPTRIHRVPYHPKSILIPNYDIFSCSLIAAAFEKAGYKPYLLEESPTSITSSLRLNDGQCLPLSAIAQSAIETIKKYNLEIDDCALFLNTLTNLSCNFPQYPIMAEQIFNDVGHGFEKLQIFASQFEMYEFPLEVITDVYTGYLLGGLLRRIACKIRPYELISGQTDRHIEQARQSIYKATVAKQSRQEVFQDIVKQMSNIPLQQTRTSRPKVSIIGDLYVRDNDVFNQQLILELESYGAEVVTTPFTFILRLLAFKHKNILKEDGRYISLMKFGLLVEFLEQIERRYYRFAEDLLEESFPTLNDDLFNHFKTYSLSLDHGGETAQNLLKIFALLDHYPDIALFIHVNPIFCCPGLVSESIFNQVEQDINRPIVSIIYDGTLTNRNDILAPYIHYLKN
jgi:predicted CoA-substrate-specific enzyme activase